MALLIFTAIVFCRLGNAHFLNWDDPITIEHNPRIFPATWHGLGEIWSQTQGHLYIPVTYTVWWLLAAIISTVNWGPDATAHAFHILNIVIHLFSVAAVYLLLRSLSCRAPGRRALSPSPDTPGEGRGEGLSSFILHPSSLDLSAWLGAAIFALHPVQVEAVAWCSGTKDLLAGALGLWAIYFLLRSRALLGTVLFAMALLAKPSGVVLPVLAGVLLLYENRKAGNSIAPHPHPLPEYQARECRRWSARKYVLIIWLLLCIPIIVIGRMAQSAGASEFHVPWFARPIVALDAIGFYLRKIVWPVCFAVDYGHSPLNVLTATRTVWVVSAVLIIGGAIYLLRRRLPCLALAAIVFVVALLPVLGFVPFDFQDYSTTADHYLYVAMLGPAIVAVAWARFRIVKAILSAMICVLAIVTIHQCGFWADNVELFSHNLRDNSRSGMSHVNLALALADKGEWELADEHYHAALRLNFAYSRAHFGVGEILAMRGQTKEALAHFEVASHLEPDDPLIHYNLAIALESMNRPGQAITEYNKSLAIEPNFVAAQTNLGALLLKSGDLSGAEQHFRAALQVNPNSELARRGLQAVQQLRNQSKENTKTP